MKKLFTLLAALMLTVTMSFAQHNFYFWEKNGNLSVEETSRVDSLIFSAGDQIFQIPKPISSGATTNAFQGTVKVAFNEKVKSIDVTPEIGICYSCENTNPTYNDRNKYLGSMVQDYSFTIMNVLSGTTYYYRTYVKLLGEVYYSEVSSITTKGEAPEQNIVINGHKFVDLGLSSGLLWAETNVGASSATEDGDYFAWGETETKPNYEYISEETYKWGRIYESGEFYKYNSSDKKTLLDPEDDAAYVRWGAPCRMPTSSEFEELCNECEWSWTSDYNGAEGYLVTGINGKSIFFLASDALPYQSPVYEGPGGSYWSSNLDSNDYNTALALSYFKLLNGVEAKYPDHGFSRYCGKPIRPVVKK